MRNELIEAIKRELVGPDPGHHAMQDNGEEILETSPRERYACGILFPQQSVAEQLDLFDELRTEQTDSVGALGIDEMPAGNGSPDETGGEEEDTINLSTTYMQSAMGFTCILSDRFEALEITVTAGIYNEYKKAADSESNNQKLYGRKKIEQIFIITRNEMPDSSEPLPKNIQDTALKMYVHKRVSNYNEESANYYTFTLVNTNHAGKSFDYTKCFFQVSLTVRSKNETPCFLPLPLLDCPGQHEDDESLAFLYRNHRTFAVGHGCAVQWKADNLVCRELHTEIIPQHKVLSIIPSHFRDLKLSMHSLAASITDKDQLKPLDVLCDKYALWIEEQALLAEKEPEQHDKEIAFRHIAACRKAQARMRHGHELLLENDECLRAFALANEAMFLQQIHYSLPLREAEFDESTLEHKYSACSIPTGNVEVPLDPELLPAEFSRYGEWHPFQMAFILMNIDSFHNPASEDRETAELIWFPTGGGKTEAYLGLSAFVIFLRRLRNYDDKSTAIIMRYTLRLLTSQQFWRASSLICSAELIRQRESDLGDRPITLGLWVGAQAAPNSRQDAVKALRDLQNGVLKENPFILLKCPWCGAQMGLSRGKRPKVLGYMHDLDPSTVRYLCPDKKCIFSKTVNFLPLLIIDEDIYEQPPTLLIGTVDKFAMLVWRPEARSLFGIGQDGKNMLPPELIIQDELHLISSSLGSVVGHYEMMINELATAENDGQRVPPKIVASTATISRAKEQITALYGKRPDQISIFPPQGLEIGKSFFAQLAEDESGRLYLGVFPAGLVSRISAQVRLVAALLQAAQDIQVNHEQERDPYWTLVEYFNSLRELGTAATLVTSYLSDHLKRINKRGRLRLNKNQPQERKIKRHIELTSRIGGSQIPTLLASLGISYPNEKEQQIPVDICLATNMISVGLDISRLGLMVVIGQPKLTSEYIQATSRIGRHKMGPGLVVTLYNPFRSRDRSYYEQFHHFHSNLYQFVEPCSVTPFSAPVREKALHAILVGLARFWGEKDAAEYPTPPSNIIQDKIRQAVHSRVSISQPEEVNESLTLLDHRINHWKRMLPEIYGNHQYQEKHCLIYPAGSFQSEENTSRAWPTLSSMRDVEKSCELMVMARDYKEVKE